MNKNRGFTLIELLAVIVILSVIALITIPLVMGVIERTQVSAYKESLRSIFNATDIYLATNGFGDIPEEGIDVTDPTFPLKNNDFLSGKIVKNGQGNLELNNITDGHYCGSGTLDNIVVVKESCDTTAPVITVTSGTLEIGLGSIYEDVGVTATDDIEGNITNRIITTGVVDTSKIGTYTLTYNVSDSSGNEATEKTRTVNVVAALATIATSETVTNLTSTSATVSGEVTSDGGGSITERGIVYGTSPNPTVSGNKVVVSGTTGTFSDNLTGLTNDKTYYARTYAINSAGTSYGNEITFLTNMGGIDEYTKLMLHFDGSDNGTVFTDETGKTLSRYGNTVTKTGTKKFGTASAYFDGNGDYLALSDSNDWYFGSADFTVESYIYLTNDNLYMYSIVGQYYYPGDALARAWSFQYYPSNVGLTLYWYGAVFHTNQTYSIGLNDWHHLAVVRSGNTLMMFYDGAKISEQDCTGLVLSDSNRNLEIGYAYGNDHYYFQGYMDELRISKGIARWTSNFTPPGRPYTP